MANDEIRTLLETVKYAHFAVSLDDQPYIVPVHYAYEEPNFYIYTTDGRKAEIIRKNPQVCLQVEEVIDNTKWQSVIVEGVAEQLTTRKEIEKAMELLLDVNPTLTPAISIRWMDNWIRENREIIYRITPSRISGRTTVNVETRAAFAQQMSDQKHDVL